MLPFSQVAHVHADVLPPIPPPHQRAHFQFPTLVKLPCCILTDVGFLRPELAQIPGIASRRLSSFFREAYCPEQSNHDHVFHDPIITYSLPTVGTIKSQRPSSVPVLGV